MIEIKHVNSSFNITKCYNVPLPSPLLFVGSSRATHYLSTSDYQFHFYIFFSSLIAVSIVGAIFSPLLVIFWGHSCLFSFSNAWWCSGFFFVLGTRLAWTKYRCWCNFGTLEEVSWHHQLQSQALFILEGSLWCIWTPGSLYRKEVTIDFPSKRCPERSVWRDFSSHHPRSSGKIY